MNKRNPEEIKREIIEFLKENGPSLPVQISRKIQLETIFTSAFLSELVSQQKIKLSKMKVGTSPIYYLEETKNKLENFADHLNFREKQAFILLKEKKFLEDAQQDPITRVALREIRDFAKPFQFKDNIYWRYFLEPAENFIKPKEKILEKISEEKIENNVEEKTQIIETKNNIEEKIPVKEIERISPEEKKDFVNPLAKKENKKPTKKKSEFVFKIIDFINSKNWKIVKEENFKSKEYICLVQINSDLGPIIFLTQAKNKKTITEKDLSKLLAESQAIPLPALFISDGNLSKKAQEYLKEYNSILKFAKINF
jgi:hypothetical protein